MADKKKLPKKPTLQQIRVKNQRRLMQMKLSGDPEARRFKRVTQFFR